MRIAAIAEAPALELPCLVPTGRGRTREERLPVLRGVVTGLPKELDGLLLASDLQAREVGPQRRPIGVALAEAIAAACPRWGLRARRIGAVLAGDLYTEPSLGKRFGVGDVTETWDAFADRFRWATGVLGNVDRLPPAARKRHALLDDRVEAFDGLEVGGVTGIIGDPRMENRRTEAAALRVFERLLRRRPALLVAHEGPAIPGGERRGNEAIRRVLRSFEGLVVCGHCRWPEPLAQLRSAQVVNTDGRCLLLTPR